jgi:hypothetical protein
VSHYLSCWALLDICGSASFFLHATKSRWALTIPMIDGDPHRVLPRSTRLGLNDMWMCAGAEGKNLVEANKKAQECHRSVKRSKNSLLENQTIHGCCKLGDLALPPSLFPFPFPFTFPFSLNSALHTAPALLPRLRAFTAALRSRR